MLKKMLISYLIISCLLLISVSSVIAIDEEETLPDDEDDVLVLDLTSEEGEEQYTDDKPNVDITEVKYDRTGKQVTLTLTVNPDGVIENRGNIDDLDNPDLESYNAIIYSIYLYTSSSEDGYQINYINNSCTLNDSADDITYLVDDNSITFNFDLDSDDETYVGILATILDISAENVLNAVMYSDECTDIPEEVVVDVGGPYSGNVGQKISFDGSAEEGAEPYEWKWNFGDGETSTEENPKHSYSKAGTYTVTLTITDAVENSDTDSTTVKISETQEEEESGGSNLLLFIGLIVIIAIVGVAILIYVLRR